MFLVFRCRKCGRFLSAKAGQKTKRCPQCGYLTQFSRVKVSIYAKAENQLDAIYLIQLLQEKYFGKKS